MSIATVRYFHSASLRQRFVDALECALQGNRIRPAEQQWLQTVTLPLVAGDPDPVRVDRLACVGGSLKPFELSAALMLSHARTDSPSVYLYTLASGFEPFTSRHTLLSTLRARFANGDAGALFEYEKIEGDPFHAQMLAIVDHQVEHVRQLTAQLKVLPSLSDAAIASLSRQLHKNLAHITIDPETHLLQIVRDSTRRSDTFPTTMTLAQAVLDDFCKVAIEEGLERRFLDAQGLPADATDTGLFARSVADAAAEIATSYEELLGAFWKDVWSDQRTRRDLAIESFSDSLRRELYECRHAGTLGATTLNAILSLLQPAVGSLPADKVLRCASLKVKVGESASYPLAGTFILQSDSDIDRSVLWFSSEHKLVRFADLAALSSHLATVQGRAQLRPALALRHQAVLLGEGQLQVDLEQIPDPLFADRVDSIIALQANNLRYAAGLFSAPDKMWSMIDDALDVRQFLDPRQLQFSAGRWCLGVPRNFADVWIKLRPEPAVGAQMPTPALTGSPLRQSESAVEGDVDRTPRASWLEQTRALDTQAERLRGLNNVLRHCAEQGLQEYLCVLADGAVRVQDMRVQWLESGPADPTVVEPLAVPVSESQRAISTDLVSLLLGCVSGHRPPVLTVTAQILFGSLRLPQHASVELINHVLERVIAGFTNRYVQDFQASRLERQRHGNESLQPFKEALRLREQAMRLDLALGNRQARIDTLGIDMVRQVLNRPVRSLRIALERPLTEAFLLSVVSGENSPAVLSDTMVLSQRDKPSPVMFWSSVLGWRQLASIERLQDTLQHELHGAKRERWLQLLGERDQTLLRAHLSRSSGDQIQIRLHRVDGHAIQAVQEQSLARQSQDLRQLCLRAARFRCEAGVFTWLANAAEVDGPLTDTLDCLAVRIDNSLFEATLPSWLTTAPLNDLKLYHDLLERYYLSSNGGHDFLFGIATMQDYARQRLVEQLSQDFPNQTLDPDQITVVSRRYVTASMVGQVPSGVPAATVRHSESLTEYAINRFSNDQGAVLSIESVAQPVAVRLLGPEYLRRLVRRLDVGAGYVELLRKALTPGDAAYATRNRLFLEQAPLMLMGVALPDKLQGNLSVQAYQFIARVFDMPDGIAREPVDGVRVIISPLQLVADHGMSPDTVAGVYLICNATLDAGPIVLCAIHHSPFVFREYASRTALMSDIRNNQALQQLLLERLDPEVRRRYDHGGFTEPHLPFSVESLGDVPLRAPGPVTLAVTEFKGNALQCLFNDTIKLLLDTGVSNAVSNDQADQAGRTFLAMLGVEQVLSLLPGKLAALVTLWQSETLFRASAVSVSGRRWGEALSEFSAALGVMVTAREQAILEKIPEDQVGAGAEAPDGDGDDSPSAFSWRHTSLSADQQARLQGLEARHVALSHMRHDNLLNLYLDTADDTPYAVVGGKVYQVRHATETGEWSIVGADGTPGPQLSLDSNQRWQLNLDLRLRGGGGVVTKSRATKVDQSADAALVIEASGMPDIRLRYRDRARRIYQAHLKARHYLENCMDNLNAHQGGDALQPDVTRIIGEFFGVDIPDQLLLTDTQSAIRALFDEVMDVSLSPFSSPRFVVGSNRPGREAVTAFIIKEDPQRRVFLTEKFFNVPRYALKPEAAAQGFETSIHHRAAILLHELSHQVLDTYDIAYLEVMAPYPDLLLGDTADNLDVLAHVERLQRYQLSHRSARSDLFMLNEDGQWRDIAPADKCGFHAILQITQTTTLDDARDVFLSDLRARSRIMLRNADSLVLLILNLGRHNLVPSSA